MIATWISQWLFFTSQNIIKETVYLTIRWINLKKKSNKVPTMCWPHLWYSRSHLEEYRRNASHCLCLPGANSSGTEGLRHIREMQNDNEAGLLDTGKQAQEINTKVICQRGLQIRHTKEDGTSGSKGIWRRKGGVPQEGRCTPPFIRAFRETKSPDHFVPFCCRTPFPVSVFMPSSWMICFCLPAAFLCPPSWEH